ncbi:hypothetical protein BDF20DRAFT_834461 [Mycotypha africana]|uniref:uncharacterized protein n=1 Tax=Mycotypha africana TaxID=64632 RepID=UPI002301E3AE|nr:uncharacterized protein BDF20DRAFT_834461 [Mycotypha africana]KAI8981780.1 hypothetical protein BDF20DRAFT_834461 [Mycotypha africana]
MDKSIVSIMTDPIPSTATTVTEKQLENESNKTTASTEQSHLKRHTEDELDTREPKAPKLSVVQNKMDEDEADKLTAEFIIDDADEEDMVDLGRTNAKKVKDTISTEANGEDKANATINNDNQPQKSDNLSDESKKTDEVLIKVEKKDQQLENNEVTTKKDNEDPIHHGINKPQPPQIIAPPPPPPGLHLLTPEQQQQLLQSSYHGGQEFATTLAQAMITPVAISATGLPPAVIIQQMQQNGVLSAGNGIITPLAGPPPSLNPQNTSQTSASNPSSSSPQPQNQQSQQQQQQQSEEQSHHPQTQTSPSTSSRTSPDTSPQPPQLIPVSGSPTITTIATVTTTANNNTNNDKQRPNTRSLSNDEKRQRRLLRNRVAAKECRKKKKQHIQDMEQKILQLEDENKKLKDQVDELRAKLGLPSLATTALSTTAAPTTTDIHGSAGPTMSNNPKITSRSPTMERTMNNPALTAAPAMTNTNTTPPAVQEQAPQQKAVTASISNQTKAQTNSTTAFYTLSDAEELEALNAELGDKSNKDSIDNKEAVNAAMNKAIKEWNTINNNNNNDNNNGAETSEQQEQQDGDVLMKDAEATISTPTAITSTTTAISATADTSNTTTDAPTTSSDNISLNNA